MRQLSQISENLPVDVPVPDPPFWSKTSWIQVGYGMWANQVVVLIGLTFGFSAIVIPQLSEPGAVFKPNIGDRAWIASIVVLVAPIGCLICGFLMDRIGRRWMLVISAVPMVIGWTYTAFSDTAIKMIQGRVITGIGVGLCASSPRTYTTEISLPNVRGVTGVIPTFSVTLGILVQSLLGSSLKWQMICYICAIYSGLVMLMNLFLPETPYFVLLGGDLLKLRKVLKRFRAKDYNIDLELENMVIFKENNHIRKLTLKKSLLKLLKPYSLKPFCIIMFYMLAGQLSGMSIMMFWTVDLVKYSNSSVDPYIGNIVLGLTRLITAFGAWILVYRVPRRSLAITTAFSLGILCICLGLYLKVTVNPSIVPLIGFMIYVLCATLGYYSLPMMMLYELIPLQVRGALGGISVSMLFLMMFLANASFPYIRSWFGMPATLILFGVFSLLGSLYLFALLPETKDLTLQQIEEFYKGKRATLSRVSIYDPSRKSHRSLMAHKLSIHMKNEEMNPTDYNDFRRRKSSVTFVLAGGKKTDEEDSSTTDESTGKDSKSTDKSKTNKNNSDDTDKKTEEGDKPSGK